MKNHDEDYAYGVQKQAEIDAYSDAQWAQLIGQKLSAAERRPQRYVRHTGLRPEDFAEDPWNDAADRALGIAIIITVVAFAAIAALRWLS